ncbi:nitronate monooxygenase [Aurantiacibacter zhengii]|uniref:Nitronate monooxygenase n=2 Tax=Aurantiacibacter zhengii TaxID=2307003 RepID=A0A418NQV8_9SPHN|nr:nitronate monooxygenase [Aurantiacibacter zhengii]RIV85017.1 nitronate monooxygenase [Aurantiacibacter zhengii]
MLDRFNLQLPIIQAPMAGVSTPMLAAAVSDAGGLGSIGVGATDASNARSMVAEIRAATTRAFNVNVFVHKSPQPDSERESAWLATLAPMFRKFEVAPPKVLRVIYKSFLEDEDMLRALIDLRPAMVSFHFGIPSAEQTAALRQAGCFLVATATSLDEAQAARRAGMDAVVAQGYEAGGHRGMFDPNTPDDCLGTLPLTRLLVRHSGLPVIAAGGIMDGQGIRAVLDMGAVAAQLGTAFIACPESSADTAYRTALFSPAAQHTIMTRAISGRPARCLRNDFTDFGQETQRIPPEYPTAYDAGKALNAGAKTAAHGGFGAQWAGQGAPLARALPAAELIAELAREMRT